MREKLTQGELAELAGVSAVTVSRLRTRGLFTAPFEVVGTTYLYDPSALDVLLEAIERAPRKPNRAKSAS